MSIANYHYHVTPGVKHFEAHTGTELEAAINGWLSMHDTKIVSTSYQIFENATGIRHSALVVHTNRGFI